MSVSRALVVRPSDRGRDCRGLHQRRQLPAFRRRMVHRLQAWHSHGCTLQGKNLCSTHRKGLSSGAGTREAVLIVQPAGRSAGSERATAPPTHPPLQCVPTGSNTPAKCRLTSKNPKCAECNPGELSWLGTPRGAMHHLPFSGLSARRCAACCATLPSGAAGRLPLLCRTTSSGFAARLPPVRRRHLQTLQQRCPPQQGGHVHQRASPRIDGEGQEPRPAACSRRARAAFPRRAAAGNFTHAAACLASRCKQLGARLQRNRSLGLPERCQAAEGSRVPPSLLCVCSAQAPPRCRLRLAASPPTAAGWQCPSA